jgi:hypothetical protein
MDTKMTVAEALAQAEEWASSGKREWRSGGWRIVCGVLADEVHRLRHEQCFEAVAFRHRYGAGTMWFLSEMPAPPHAADHEGFEEEPLYTLKPMP